MEFPINGLRKMITPKPNRLELRVIAGPRSGHNAVLNWVFGLFSGEVLYYSDVSLADSADASTAILPLKTVDDLVRDLYVACAENVDLTVAYNGFETNKWRTYAGISERVEYVLILRDPYNTFASMIRYFGVDRSVELMTVERWKQYALQFLGLTRYLPRDTIYISFNDWFISKNYRRLIAHRLGVPFNDRNIHRPVGPASAFQPTVDDARMLNVLERWIVMLCDRSYRDIFHSDPELHCLAEEIYGESMRTIKNALCG